MSIGKIAKMGLMGTMLSSGVSSEDVNKTIKTTSENIDKKIIGRNIVIKKTAKIGDSGDKMTITTVFPEKNKGSICYKIKGNTGCALNDKTILIENPDKTKLIRKAPNGRVINIIPNPNK